MIGTAFAAFAAAAGAPVGNYYVPVDKLPWYREAPNIPAELAPLWGDRSKGEAGTYLRVPGGWEAPLHYHTADYWAVAVQGEWSHWVPSTGEGKGIRLLPGAHWTQIKDQPHEDKCLSPTACIIFLFNRDAYETKFVPEGAATKK
jgi:hypothetical protein